MDVGLNQLVHLPHYCFPASSSPSNEEAHATIMHMAKHPIQFTAKQSISTKPFCLAALACGTQAGC